MLRRPHDRELMEAPPGRARILIADENASFRAEAAGLLEQRFEILAECSSGASLLLQAARLKPDVIVLELSLGDLTGIETIRRLRERGAQAKIVVLSMHENPDFARAAFAAGASAYVFKSSVSLDLVPAVEAVLRGDLFISHRVA